MSHGIDFKAILCSYHFTIYSRESQICILMWHMLISFYIKNEPLGLRRCSTVAVLICILTNSI